MGAVARASGLDPDVLDAQLLLVLLDRDGDVHLPVLPMAALDAAPDECVLLAAPGRREIVEDVQHAMQALFRSEEHTSELQSRGHLVCRLLLEKKNYLQY